MLVQSQSTPSGKSNSRLCVSGTHLTRYAKPCMAGVGSFFRLERQGTPPPLLPPFAREISPSAPPSNNRRLLRSLVHAVSRCGSTIAMNLFWIRESFCTKTVINRPLFSSSKEILESFQLTSTFEKSKATAHFEINDKNGLKKLKIEK